MKEAAALFGGEEKLMEIIQAQLQDKK